MRVRKVVLICICPHAAKAKFSLLRCKCLKLFFQAQLLGQTGQRLMLQPFLENNLYISWTKFLNRNFQINEYLKGAKINA